MIESITDRVQILPRSSDEVRPLWSVMIPTYNCAHYLRHTLASVLAQDLGSEVMQIEVIDDHSTEDDPEAVVKELGKDRVEFYRQPQNQGYIRNFETCLQRSRGHLIHILHGDDGVRDGFYRQLQTAFETHPEIGAAYCRQMIMDEWGNWQKISDLEQSHSGILSQALERILVRHPIQTPAIVVRRSVYETLGGFDRRIASCGEDWEMWVRIALHYPIWYEVAPLALYRSHSTSLSGRAVRTGQDLRDVRMAYEIIQSYLPATIPRQLSEKAKEFWAFSGLYRALELLSYGDWQAVKAQMQEVIKFNPSLKVMLVSLFYLTIGILKYWSQESDPKKMFLPAKNAKLLTPNPSPKSCPRA